jgi:hypothetical protein
MSRNRPTFVLALGLVLALIAGLSADSARAQVGTGIIRVATTGSDVAGCGSAGSPCRTPYFAVLQSIQSGQFLGEIRIAGGRYSESADVDLIKITVYSSNLRITGGYPPGNWNTSDPANNPTVLDGQNSKRGIRISVPTDVAPLCNVTVSNLTIENAHSTTAIGDTYGAGLLVDNCKNARLANVTIQNSAATGLANTGNPAASPGAGGGIAVRGAGQSAMAGLTLQNVTLANNQAVGGDEGGYPRGGLGAGAGLYSFYGTVNASGLTVSGNTAQAGSAPGGSGEDSGQRADGLGGGITLIYSSFNLSGLIVTQNVTRGGTAAGKGGLGLGGGLNIELSTGTISNANISGNQASGAAGGSVGGAALGGGIFSTDSALTLEATKVIGNSTQSAPGGDSGGGGIWLTTGQTANNSLNGTNIVVAKNGISGTGGVLLGAGLGCGASQLALNHATFAANTGGGGTAMALVGFSANAPCGGSIRNSIVANHAGKPISVNQFVGTTTIANTLASGNGDVLVDNPSGRPVSESNTFSGNPNFVDAGNNDYRIGGGSAAIDKASGQSPSTDIEGQVRPVGAAADVGADEYQVALSGVASDTSITLSWQAPPATNVTRYDVVYTKESGASSPDQGSSPINAGGATGMTLTGLTKGAAYTVTIVAYNGGSEVARSRALTLRTGVYVTYLPVVIN